MKIGITYDLRQDYLAEGYGLEETAEFDRGETIDAIELGLRSLRYETERIGNVKQLVKALAQGRRWDMVFNIAEGMYGYGREGVIPALLDAYEIPCVFSDPLTMALTLHKGMAKHVVRANGVSTPDFMVVEREADLANFAMPYPVFAKPVAEGTGKGVAASSVIRNDRQLREVCAELLARHRQPVLVEEFLPGREFTVAIVGTGETARALGAMEIILLDSADPEVYTYDNKEECEERVRYALVEDAALEAVNRVGLAAYRALGVRDAGRVDLRMSASGEMHFLEVNPLAGLHPEHSDMPIICNLSGIGYSDLLDMIMNSARARLDLPASSQYKLKAV